MISEKQEEPIVTNTQGKNKTNSRLEPKIKPISNSKSVNEVAMVRSLSQLFDFQHCIDSISNTNGKPKSNSITQDPETLTKKTSSSSHIFDSYNKEYILYSQKNDTFENSIAGYKDPQKNNKWKKYDKKLIKIMKHNRLTALSKIDKNLINCTNYILLNDLITGEALEL